MKKGFFSKFDWAACWVATLVSFAVYFYTLGPSVGLEDSGELATASAHLGVPHPPGYPFWTLCTWVFCRLFSFVTYMGHPNPAWAVSCCSAVFGALAAGCTAMLICRSAGDFVFNKRRDSLFGDVGASLSDYLCFGGGVGGALAFAFSPVEWSQSTIVEIYSLNSLFLMLVFLLSYRWMSRPSDKVLWFTAFVFGLGLTNYQVLLFAIVPLAIIICLKNFRMFRDFALYLFPVALTYQILKIAEMPQANEYMASNVINKHNPIELAHSCPSTYAIITAVVLCVAAILAAVVMKKHSSSLRVRNTFFVLGVLSLVVMALAACGVLGSDVAWVFDGVNPATGEKGGADFVAPLINPKIYVTAALFLMASVLASVYAVVVRSGSDGERRYKIAMTSSAAMVALAALVVCSSVDFASAKGYVGAVFDWKSSSCHFYAVIAALIACSLFVKNALAYSIPVAGFHVVLFMLLERGAMNGLTHPSSWWFWWPVAWNFVVLALAWLILPYGRSVAFAAFFAQLGVSFYAYMPIVSELRNPPMNWGYPRTWEGFKHAITRGQYEAITMPEFAGVGEFFNHIRGQMLHYFSEVKMQFTDYIALLAFIPLASWSFITRISGRKRVISVVIVCSAILSVLALRALSITLGIGTGVMGQHFDALLILAIAFLAVMGVCVIAFKQFVFRPAIALRRYIEQLLKRSDYLHLGAMVALLADVLFVFLYHWSRAESFPVVFLPVLVFAGFFAFAVWKSREAIRFSNHASDGAVFVSFGAKNISQQWLLASGACFFMMTLPLILLAQVKGDIQDGFIQKVKFISSHAMIAMWIGYGLVILGAAVLLVSNRWIKENCFRKGFAAFVIVSMLAGAGITPIIQNYIDDELVFALGGSEQNDHSFGWQFGAYQLDGAKAIRAQITADEEPLPDPDWPAPMEPYSIFFGGTDPGRFVPTYMIYGANFRPDIYLITQNALADDTYMSVQRDLYGDEIWIPSKEDSANAFQVYVDEVKRGVRPANGDLKTENGRVQVTGALGVMEINGILTKMMHDHDKNRHTFYVEESYAIQWMYPYLSPHGLIMKINPEKVSYDPALASLDMDFWDWYTRRLLNDPMFRRDFAAQKSFSKLRSALAGLYRTQHRFSHAAQAFREAHLLYPASPEATFRYISEILMPMDKVDVIRELINYTDRIDPNNKRTGRLHKYLDVRKRIEELEVKFKSSQQTLGDVIELSGAYFDAGHVAKAANLISQAIDYLTDESDLLHASEILLSARKIQQADRVVRKYMAKAKSPDPRLMLQWAVVSYMTGPEYRETACSYVESAAKIDPSLTVRTLSSWLPSLDMKDADYRLWIVLAKLQHASSNKKEAVIAFYHALMVNQEVVSRQAFHDPVLRELMQECRKMVLEQQRR